MAVLTDLELGRVILAAGFTGDAAVTAWAVANAESSKNTRALNYNPPSNTWDRGLFQINSVHKSYTTECLYEPGCNARAAFAISNGGTNWQPWSSYKNGRYKQHLTRARVVMTSLTGTSAPSSSGGGSSNPLGSVVDAAGNVIEGFIGGQTAGVGLAAGAARSLLGLDEATDRIFTAGLGLVLTAGALVIIAIGLSRLTGRGPADIAAEVDKAKAAALAAAV